MTDEQRRCSTTVYGDNAYGTGRAPRAPRGRRHRLALQDPAPTTPAGCSPRTASLSTSARETVTCPARSPLRSGVVPTAVESPTSPTPVPLPAAIECATATGGRTIGSAPTKCPGPGPERQTTNKLARRLPGHPTESRTQARPSHEAQARRASGTCAARRESTPTSDSWPRQPTWPVSARSEFGRRRGDGR